MGKYSCDLLRYLLEITVGVTRLSGDNVDMGDHKPAALRRSELDAQGGPETQLVRPGMWEAKQAPGLWSPFTRHGAFLFNFSCLPAVWEIIRGLLFLSRIKSCPSTA